MSTKRKEFSIIEMSIVVLVVLLLMTISLTVYKTAQRSFMVKNQLMEFENIRIAIGAYKLGLKSTAIPSNKHVSLFDLIYTYQLLSEKRTLLKNGNDPKGKDEMVMSYFDTPIEVYVCKLKTDSKFDKIEASYKQFPKNKYLTGGFEFYFGNDHEVDGGESSADYGLVGNGTFKDAHQYFYKFVYAEPDGGPKHEYTFH